MAFISTSTFNRMYLFYLVQNKIYEVSNAPIISVTEAKP